jgi:hypothetical protein
VFKNTEFILCEENTMGAAAVGFLAGRYGVRRTGGDWLLILVSSEKDAILYPHTVLNEKDKATYPEHLFRHAFKESALTCPETFKTFVAAARIWPLGQIIVLQAPVNRLPEIDNWFMSISSASFKRFTKQEQEMMDKLCINWRLTFHMQSEFNNLCVSKKNSGGDLSQILAPHFDTVCANKQERAAAFGRLRQILCE